MRIIGFIQIFTLTLVNLTLRRRLPPRKVTGGLFNWAAFKSAPFTIYCASTFVNFLGIYTGTFSRLRLSLQLLTRNSTPQF